MFEDEKEKKKIGGEITSTGARIKFKRPPVVLMAGALVQYKRDKVQGTRYLISRGSRGFLPCSTPRSDSHNP